MKSARKIAQEWWDSPPNESATGEEIEAVAKLIDDARDEAFEAAVGECQKVGRNRERAEDVTGAIKCIDAIRALAKGTL